MNAQEYEEMIRSVSGKAVADFMRRVLSSKPSLAAFGNGAEAVNYDALLQRYSSRANSQGLGLLKPGGFEAARARGLEQQGRGQIVHGVLERLKQGVLGGSAPDKGPTYSSKGSSSRSSSGGTAGSDCIVGSSSLDGSSSSTGGSSSSS